MILKTRIIVGAWRRLQQYRLLFLKDLRNNEQANYGPICLLRATEQLRISHLFIQSTALFALSNICVLR